jgi:hypothetical protein
MRPKSTKSDSVCRQCGVTFTPLPNSTGTFCGQPCCYAYRRDHRQSLPDRFWAKVDKTDGCWLWTGCIAPTGYGQIMNPDTRVAMSAHRVSWELHFGQIPDGLFVLHRCDVRACVRPDHLFLGTNADNMTDKTQKRRHSFGESHPLSRLTESDVRAIHAEWEAGGTTQRAIADRFGIDRSQVSEILSGRAWSHVKSRSST